MKNLFNLKEMEHSETMELIHPDEWSLEDNGCDQYVSGKWRREFVLLEETEPWEETPAVFPASLVKHDEVWRLYYHHSTPANAVLPVIALAEYFADGTVKKYPCMINQDGYFSIHGIPDGSYPVQGNVFRLEKDLFRLYFWCHYPAGGICRFLIAESSNGRNFKVVYEPALYHHYNDEDSRYRRVSEWLRTNDATTVYRLPDGSWELYTACIVLSHKGEARFMQHDVGTGSTGAIRLVERFTSPDGIHWDQRPRLVVVPDQNDGPWQQFYGMTVSPYCNGIRYGVLCSYNADAQTDDFENVISRDSVNWKRFDRNASLEREEGIYGVYPGHNFLTADDGRLYLFHQSSNSTHNGKIVTGGKLNVMNYVVSIDPLKYIIRQVNGSVISPPWRFKGKTAVLPIKPKGDVKVELLDVFGEKPRELTYCVSGDGIAADLPEMEVAYGRFRVSGEFEIFSGKINELP